MLNQQTKILLIIFAGIVVIYFLFAGTNNQAEAFNGESDLLPQNMEQDINSERQNSSVISDDSVILKCNGGKKHQIINNNGTAS